MYVIRLVSDLPIQSRTCPTTLWRTSPILIPVTSCENLCLWFHFNVFTAANYYCKLWFYTHWFKIPLICFLCLNAAKCWIYLTPMFSKQNEHIFLYKFKQKCGILSHSELFLRKCSPVVKVKPEIVVVLSWYHCIADTEIHYLHFKALKFYYPLP